MGVVSQWPDLVAGLRRALQSAALQWCSLTPESVHSLGSCSGRPHTHTHKHKIPNAQVGNPHIVVGYGIAASEYAMAQEMH